MTDVFISKDFKFESLVAQIFIAVFISISVYYYIFVQF